MKYILAMDLKWSYRLFDVQLHVIVISVSSISYFLNISRKIVNANIFWLWLGITSSQTLFSIIYQATRTAN